MQKEPLLQTSLALLPCPERKKFLGISQTQCIAECRRFLGAAMIIELGIKFRKNWLVDADFITNGLRFEARIDPIHD